MKLLKKLLKNGESGQAFIMVLAMLALGSLLMIPTLNLANTSIRYHRTVEKNTLETYAADCGVQYALCKIGNDIYAYQVDPLEHYFTVNDKTVDVTAQHLGNDVYKITSTAITDSESSTTIESYAKLLGEGIFGNAITVLNGNVMIENSTINGDIYAGGQVFLENSVVNGTVTELGTETFDLLDIEPYRTEALGGGTINGNLVLGEGTHYLGPNYITGYLKIEEAANVILGGTVYVEGAEWMGSLSIFIEAGATVTGTGDFIAEEGGIKIELSRFELDNIPLIAALSSDIEKGEDCEYIKGMLYAPNGKVLIEDLDELYGSLFAHTMEGHAVQYTTINYPLVGDSDLIGVGGFNIITWQISK